MKYTCIILFLVSLNCFSQLSDDYKILNQFLSDFNKTLYAQEIKMYETPATFINQEKFFKPDFFQNYTYRVAGVDGKKIKKLIKKLDFNFLSNEKTERTLWSFDNIKEKVIKYDDENKPNQLFVRRYNIAKPVYTKDKIFAFVYYEINCGPECSSASVSIYKKVKNVWFYYTQIPIWLS